MHRDRRRLPLSWRTAAQGAAAAEWPARLPQLSPACVCASSQRIALCAAGTACALNHALLQGSLQGNSLSRHTICRLAVTKMHVQMAIQAGHSLGKLLRAAWKGTADDPLSRLLHSSSWSADLQEIGRITAIALGQLALHSGLGHL